VCLPGKCWSVVSAASLLVSAASGQQQPTTEFR
jgi:hypothetical protein